jgi:hypothetical protein
MEFAAPHNFCKIQSIFGKWKADQLVRAAQGAAVQIQTQPKRDEAPA